MFKFNEEQMKKPQTSMKFPDKRVEKHYYLCVHAHVHTAGRVGVSKELLFDFLLFNWDELNWVQQPQQPDVYTKQLKEGLE